MKDEMDILKEIGTTAAAHGSIALSEIIGRKINLSLPSLDIIPCDVVSKQISIEGIVLTMQTTLLSGLSGKVFFILEEKSAFRLIDICYKTRTDSKGVGLYTEMGMSVVKEVGNIIISSYVNSLSFFLKKLVIPSFPIFISAPFTEILNMIKSGFEDDDYVLMIEAIFEEESEQIKGNFWLVLTAQAAEEVKTVCKKMLESLENS